MRTGFCPKFHFRECVNLFGQEKRLSFFGLCNINLARKKESARHKMNSRSALKRKQERGHGKNGQKMKLYRAKIENALRRREGGGRPESAF